MLASTGFIKHGDRAAREVSGRIGGTVADRATLALVQKAARTDGQVWIVASDNSRWTFNLASTATDTTQSLAVAPTDGLGGAFLRSDAVVDLKLPFAFGTADATALFTVPTGFKLRIERAYWEIIASMTGGSSSAIGVSSTNAAFNTKGDILGGASGDVAATLVQTGSPYKGGTLGAKLGSNGIIVLVAADVLRFDAITSAFTAGNGFVHITGQLIG